jgi:hypothetical protein
MDTDGQTDVNIARCIIYLFIFFFSALCIERTIMDPVADDR